jgi:hypothetical protein
MLLDYHGLQRATIGSELNDFLRSISRDYQKRKSNVSSIVPISPIEPQPANSEQPSDSIPSLEENAARLVVQSGSTEVERRQELLNEYKVANKSLPHKRIYEAKNSGLHKPEFYEWLNGTLPATSETTLNFERFLRDKKPPIPRKPKR